VALASAYLPPGVAQRTGGPRDRRGLAGTPTVSCSLICRCDYYCTIYKSLHGAVSPVSWLTLSGVQTPSSGERNAC
jgi:hypothetical protein